MSSKKRKISGLGGLGLQLAHDFFLKLKKATVYEASEEQDSDEEGFEQEIDTTLTLLRSKLEKPESEFWSSMNLYRQSHLLESLVPRAATKPRPVEFGDFSGLINYIAVMTDKCDAAFLLISMELAAFKMYATSVLFVMETNLFNSTHYDDRQAACEMYACGKFFQKKIIRGPDQRTWLDLPSHQVQ
ncbi:hypothetical protein BDR07DRAFT_1606389, partial [Suillus spraguei]